VKRSSLLDLDLISHDPHKVFVESPRFFDDIDKLKLVSKVTKRQD
jgi:hypothetical protein